MSPRYDYASLFMKYHSILAMPSAVFCQGGSSAKWRGGELFVFVSVPSFGWLVDLEGVSVGMYVIGYSFFPFSLFGGEVGGKRCCS